MWEYTGTNDKRARSNSPRERKRAAPLVAGLDVECVRAAPVVVGLDVERVRAAWLYAREHGISASNMNVPPVHRINQP